MTLQHDASRAAPEADPAAQGPRKLEKGWHERHMRWQAEGRIPPGRTQLRYEDGSLVFDRRGYPRMWSTYVAVKMQPGQRSSKMIAREHAQAAKGARLAAEAAKLSSMLLPSLKPLPKRLWSLHADALLLIGPAGGISIPISAVPVLQPLASGGHHALNERDAAAVEAMAPRLAVVGLRIDRRRKGIRIAKAHAGG